MKLKMNVYYTDGTSTIVTFEKPPGAHPMAVQTGYSLLDIAEKTGKSVDRFCRIAIDKNGLPYDYDCETRNHLTQYNRDGMLIKPYEIN